MQQQNVATLDEEKILPPSQPLNNNYDDKDLPKSYAAAVCPLVAVNTGQVPTQTTPNSQETRFDEARKTARDDENSSSLAPEIPDVNIEITAPMVQISHLDSSIQVNLPSYTKAAPFPNQDYNNIEKATFTRLINEIYEEIVKWKKNLFLIPTGQCGKDFIKLKVAGREMKRNTIVGLPR